MPKTQLPDDSDKANAGAPDLDDYSVGKILGNRSDASGRRAPSNPGSATAEHPMRGRQHPEDEAGGHRTAGDAR